VSDLVGLVRAEGLIEGANVVLSVEFCSTDLLGVGVPLRALTRGVLALAVAAGHGAGWCEQ
jgi:hypothetical protein